MSDRNTSDVLRKTREALEDAELGLSDLLGGDPKRRLPGFRNLVVFGRSVTFVLQTMKSADERFAAWYPPLQEEMREDPLMIAIAY